MRVGIDFDNTLIDYDRVFLAAAKERGLVASSFRGSKREVRDAIRLRSDGEHDWQSLQGYVYGAGIGGAVMCSGAADFLLACRAHAATVFVVSHKTQFGHFDPLKVDLRAAALGWMGECGFFQPDRYAIARDHVFFEATRGEKLSRIRALDCAVFIDDLEEVFGDPDFPGTVKPILYAASARPELNPCSDWQQICEMVFGPRG